MNTNSSPIDGCAHNLFQELAFWDSPNAGSKLKPIIVENDYVDITISNWNAFWLWSNNVRNE